jgi:hypothetical protein
MAASKASSQPVTASCAVTPVAGSDMVACLPGRLPLVAVFAFIQQTKFGRPARDRRVERVADIACAMCVAGWSR